MDYHELIDALNKETYWLGSSQPYSHDVHPVICDAAIEMLEHLYSELKAANARCETLNKMVTQYQDELIPRYRERAEKAETERDAAVRGLREHRTPCDTCKFKNNYTPECDNCSCCELVDCLCHHCYDASHWQWRGPQEG